jgi:hypothetical protein
LNGQWGQLQESLARQNVHLLPLEDRSGSRVAFGVPDRAPSTAQDFNQQQPSKNYQPPIFGAPETSPSELRRAAALAVNKTQTRKAPATGWESWA